MDSFCFQVASFRKFWYFTHHHVYHSMRIFSAINCLTYWFPNLQYSQGHKFLWLTGYIFLSDKYPNVDLELPYFNLPPFLQPFLIPKSGLVGIQMSHLCMGLKNKSHPVFTALKPTMETLEQRALYVQS